MEAYFALGAVIVFLFLSFRRKKAVPPGGEPVPAPEGPSPDSEEEPETMPCPCCGATVEIHDGFWECGWCGDSGMVY